MLGLASLTLVVSCSDDDDGPSNDPTCSDGIMNGDETDIDCGGSCTPCGEEPAETEDLEGEVTADTELDASVAYNLTGAYVVKSGATLTIPAGTTIKAAGGTAAFIGVERGAKINVNGTAAAPVVMTSGAANPAQGDWVVWSSLVMPQLTKVLTLLLK